MFNTCSSVEVFLLACRAMVGSLQSIENLTVLLGKWVITQISSLSGLVNYLRLPDLVQPKVNIAIKHLSSIEMLKCDCIQNPVKGSPHKSYTL